MIALSPVRGLHLVSGCPAYLSAASGLVLRGDSAFVVADDECALGVFALGSATPGRLVPLFGGEELPADPVARKRAKPDLEALFEWTAPGGERELIAVPSGSKPNRVRGARAGAAGVTELDFTDLFRALRESIPGLNLEGALEAGEFLMLFHRGNSQGSKNAVIRLDRRTFAEEVELGRITASSIRATARIELGAIGVVPLGFTDAAIDELGTVWFLAAAEATLDAYDDGAFAGAVLGRLDAESERVDSVYPLDCPVKPEGLAFGPAGTFYVVTDADDSRVPATLFRGQRP